MTLSCFYDNMTVRSSANVRGYLSITIHFGGVPLARNPNFQITVSMVDRSGEATGYSYNTAALVDTSVDPSLFTVFNTAVAAVIDGHVNKYNSLTTQKVSNADHAAAGQREEAWTCIFEDNVTFAVYKMILPCRKDSVQPPVNTDEVDLTVAPWVAFKSAFEGIVSTVDGNATTLLTVVLTGRNL